MKQLKTDFPGYGCADLNTAELKEISGGANVNVGMGVNAGSVGSLLPLLLANPAGAINPLLLMSLMQQSTSAMVGITL